MNPDRRHEIEEVFEAALDLAEPDLDRWLKSRCVGDAELLLEVRALLAAHDRTRGALEQDPVAVAQAVVALPLTRRIGPYRVVRELGRGGMGVVYLAERDDGQFRRQVAIKLLRNPDAGELHDRFVAERQILASLDHPNIAQLLDAGVTDGQIPYLVMEFVEGLPITVHCDKHRLDIDARLRLFRNVCAAVHHAHQGLILHRDLKPNNILVTGSGQVKLLDFGIAKLLDPVSAPHQQPLTRTGLRPMTPQYASPEQVLGEPLTTASDIYALGVLLYRLLTGHSPYRGAGASLHEMLLSVCHEEPERPGARVLRPAWASDEPGPDTVAAARATTPERLHQRLLGDLDAIVAMALRKEPERRYGSVEQMEADIGRHLDGHPIVARADSVTYRARKFARRHRWSLAAAAAILVLLFGYTVTITAQNRRIRDALTQSIVDNSRAAQMATLLISMFERGDGGESTADSAAAQLLERRLQRAETMFRQPRERVRMLGALARIRRHLGEFERAAVLLEEALELQRGLPDDRWADLSETRIRLAEAYRNLNRLDEAEALLREALAEDRRRLGGQHPRVAWGLNELFYVLEEQGDFGGAESAAREALTIRRRLFGTDHPDVATSMADLALVLRRRGAYQDAEPLYREAVEMHRRLTDPDTWQVAEALNSLGLVLVDLGRPKEAETILREAVERYQRIYGLQHPSVSVALNSLARALSDQGRSEEPERLFLESLEIRRATFGPEHARTATALHSLGSHYLDQTDYARAEGPLHQALDIWERSFDDGHPEVARGRSALGHLLREAGRLDSAEALLRSALEVQERSLGERHPQTGRTMHQLGLVLVARGNLTSAESLYRSAREAYGEQLDSEHRWVEALRSDLAALNAARERAAEGERYGASAP